MKKQSFNEDWQCRLRGEEKPGVFRVFPPGNALQSDVRWIAGAGVIPVQRRCRRENEGELMMVVVVVDDEKREIETLTEYFTEFQKEVQEEIVLHTFSNGQELLEAYDYSYDLICLDIDMPELDGNSVAKKIRCIDQQVLLIFVTNMAQMAIRGYEVQAFDFVLKPVDYFCLS